MKSQSGSRRTRSAASYVLVATILSAAGCGQTGPLSLPAPPSDVEEQAPQQPAAEPEDAQANEL